MHGLQSPVTQSYANKLGLQRQLTNEETGVHNTEITQLFILIFSSKFRENVDLLVFVLASTCVCVCVCVCVCERERERENLLTDLPVHQL